MIIKSLLYTFFFLSCSHTPLVREKTDLNSVEISNSPAELIEINKDELFAYGPGRSEGNVQKISNKQRKSIISLVMYTSVYQSLAFLHLIKEIEGRDVRISLVSSQGFGVVIAALYAKEQSASYLEWKLFELFELLKESQVYSKDWQKTINEFSENEFGQLKVNQLKLLLVVPKIVEGKLILIKDEKVVDVIKHSINLRDESHFIVNPRLYHGEFKDFGVDLAFAVSFLPEVIKFDLMNGFEWGLYTRYLGKITQGETSISILHSNKSAPLDQVLPMVEISKRYRRDILEYLKLFDTKVLRWQEESSLHLNN